MHTLEAPGSVPDRIRERVALTYRVLSPPVLRGMNASMREMWRLGLGWMLNGYPRWFGRYMVITTTGRTTGRLRRTSVNYVEIDGTVYCMSGWGRTSSWYRNLLVQPVVELWMTGGRFRAVGEPVSDELEARRAARALLDETGLLAPLLAGVTSEEIDDETIEALTEWWPIVRFRRTERVPRRIADHAWLWPVLAMALVLWSRRRRRVARLASPSAR